MTDQTEFLQRSGVPALAFCRFQPVHTVLPTVVFCGGFRSDMQGTKALALEAFCRQRQQPFVRFDYRGHGVSEGLFEDGTIGLWCQDALAIIDQLTTGPLVLVGSSMGGWISLLLARVRFSRMHGLIGIAAAPDFTAEMESQMNASQRAVLQQDGILRIPNHYSDEPYVITKILIEDGPQHFLLKAPLTLPCPVRLVQGMKDQDVPWQTAFRIKTRLVEGATKDVEVFLVEDGDHRLSRLEDLALIQEQVRLLSA